MARVTSWAKRYVTPVPWEASVLVQADAYWAQTMIADLEPRKARALYPTDEAFAVAYDATCKAQESLLMDVADRLIMEIRASRGGDAITSQVRDPLEDPFDLPLETMAGLTNNIDLARAKLQEILEAIQGGQQNTEGILEAIQGIAILLA